MMGRSQQPPRQRVAVVGAGISGLSAAWLLSTVHDVSLYEADHRLGGHSNTVELDTSDGPCAVDTGFIVYNPPSYPNLVGLFDTLGVETSPSSMSFAVSLDDGACEYSGSGLGGLFGQPANVFRPSHWRMTRDILRFFHQAGALARGEGNPTQSLGEWLIRQGFTRPFIDRHVIPMGAAIWSAPGRQILDFPALSFARFFANHGLLRITGRPQWRTVTGGSRRYVERLVSAFAGRSLKGCRVTAVRRAADHAIVVTHDGSTETYDHVVLACHADNALRLLDDADDFERRLLAKFEFTRNEAVLHTDPTFMPRRRRLWSSWNFAGSTKDPADAPCVTYWMNSLQPLTTRQNVFVTLNPRCAPAAGTEAARIIYEHPLFDAGAVIAQELLPQIQGRRRTWFAGAWAGYGFHEDGAQSGLWVAEQLGCSRPWAAGEFTRIFGGRSTRATSPVTTPLSLAPTS